MEEIVVSNEKKIDERKEKILAWFKDPQNLTLLAILFFAFAIRLYYSIITQNQTLWWDEAEYMSTAKHWAFNVPYDVNEQRPPLFQFLASLLLILGFSENSLKFLLVVLPSVFLVFSIYLLGKELFNKKIGLIAALFSSVMWSFLFWTSRFQPDFFSMSFQVLALVFFWKLFKTDSKKDAIYAGIFTALGFYFKVSALLVPISILGYALIRDKFKIISKKNYWMALLSFLITLIPFFIYQYLLFGSPIAFAPSYALPEYRAGRSLGWMALDFFLSFLKWPTFGLFLLGLGSFLIIYLISFDVHIKSNKNNPELLAFLVLLISACYHIFFTKGVIEDRWIFLIVPFLFFFSAKGLFIVSDYLKKINKYIGVIFILIILGFFIYGHIQHNNALTLYKLDSYSPVKDSSLWIKENLPENGSFLTISYTQAIAYSERKVITYSQMNEISLNRTIEESHPKYIVVSVFEKHPDWINSWLETNKYRLEPVKIYYLDQNRQQAGLVVYEIKYN